MGSISKSAHISITVIMSNYEIKFEEPEDDLTLEIDNHVSNFRKVLVEDAISKASKIKKTSGKPRNNYDRHVARELIHDAIYNLETHVGRENAMLVIDKVIAETKVDRSENLHNSMVVFDLVHSLRDDEELIRYKNLGESKKVRSSFRESQSIRNDFVNRNMFREKKQSNYIYK